MWRANNALRLAAFILWGALPVSCGLEEYYYLPPVPQTSVTVTAFDEARINLPAVNTSTYYFFKNFTIFYRIYISYFDTMSIPTSVFSTINNALMADYNAIYPSTDITVTSTNTAIGSLFRGRGYYELCLDNQDIRNVLSNTAGVQIWLDFSATGGDPKLYVNNIYVGSLFRSNGDGVFNPQPNRYFRNTPDICNVNNATAKLNADAARPNAGESGFMHTYAAFYIALEGLQGPPTFAPMYSKPTFIGVMKLPN